MEMLVLRRRGAWGVRNTHVPVGAGLDVEAIVQDLPPSEVHGLRRDENILGAAEPMPLTLIEPFSADDMDPAILQTTNVTWGVRAVGASTSPFTGKGVTVGILDTGVKKDHPAFAGVEIVGRNFTAGALEDFEDTNGHGTHCAGTLLGRRVENIRIGVAPGVTRAVVGKVLGPGGGSTATLFSAMNWAIEKKARVISMSLGMDLVGLRERLVAQGMHEMQATSTAMRVLIDNVRFFDKYGNLLRSGAAFGHSALVVAASGNESNRFGLNPFVLGTAYPAATEDFLSVGALEPTSDSAHPLRVASFSNAGAQIAGPGVNVMSAALDGGLKRLNGTSMATPHVAGVAVLWAQKLALTGPVTAEKLLANLKRSAQISLGLDEADVGYGIPQAPQF